MITLEHLPADLFGLSTLTREALSGRLALRGLSVARRRNDFTPPPESYLPDERTHLARWLEAKVSTYGPHVAVLDSVRSLASPGACCVVCAHRPGLLASPLVILWKALQAVKLSRVLRESWSVPVVPVFWNEADDHDVAFVHHTYVLNHDFDVQKVNLAGLSSGRIPFSRLVLTEEHHALGAVRAALRQLHGDYESVEEALELFVPRDGETVAAAFSRTMYDLLGHTGLLVLEPDWLREELSRALADVVGRPIQAALAMQEAELARRGVERGEPLERTPFVFRVDDGGRRPLRLGGDGYRYDDEPGSRTRTELAAEIVQEPVAFSPGELLAPLVRDLVLPVAADLGGLDQLTRRALIAPLWEILALEPPPLVLRASLTLVDPPCRQSAARLEVGWHELLSARGEWKPRRELPSGPDLVQALREIGRRARRELLEHREVLAATDRTLGLLVRRTADQLDQGIAKLCEKVARVQANRAGKGRRHVRRLNHGLCPRGEPQERVLGAFPFVARFGRRWIDELLEELDPLASEHVLVHLEPE